MNARVSAYLVKMVLRSTAQGYKNCYVRFDRSGWTSSRQFAWMRPSVAHVKGNAMSTVMNNDVSREVAKIVLKGQYPNLHMVEPGESGLVIAAKNIRAELKAAYPGVKFSVRAERFSMGDAIRVGWTDGPNTAQVEAITNKYKAGSFNGYEDLYEYNRSDWKDAFGSAKYISTSRGQSESLVESGIRHIAKRYGVEPITIEQYRSGGAWRWTTESGIELGTELNRYLHKLSRAMPRKV